MHPDTPKMKRGHGSKFERNNVLGLLDRGIQAVDRDDIQVRLAALERDMEEQKNKR